MAALLLHEDLGHFRVRGENNEITRNFAAAALPPYENVAKEGKYRDFHHKPGETAATREFVRGSKMPCLPS